MLVYLHGSTSTPPPARHVVYIAPAADLRGQEVPTAWVDHDNKPIQIEVLFQHGTAEVDDEVGKYLIKSGQAQKSRLVMPGAWS